MRLLVVAPALALLACASEPAGAPDAEAIDADASAVDGEDAVDGDAADGDAADGDAASGDEAHITDDLDRAGGIGPRGPSDNDGFVPTPEQERALKALSVRHPEPTCADIEAMVDDPVATFRAIVEQVDMPPWAPMRAASCLLTLHPAEAEADAIRWVSDPDRAGLTNLVVGQLDGLPIERARRIGRAAVDGPHAEIARRRLERLRSPELRALAEP